MLFRYFRDCNGKLIPAEEFVTREFRGWGATLRQAMSETANTLQDMNRDVADAGVEFTEELNGLGRASRQVLREKRKARAMMRDAKKLQRRARRQGTAKSRFKSRFR